MRNSEICRSGRKWKLPVFQIYVDLFLAGFTPQILYFHSFWNDSICKAYHTGNLLIFMYIWEQTFFPFSWYKLVQNLFRCLVLFFFLPVAISLNSVLSFGILKMMQQTCFSSVKMSSLYVNICHCISWVGHASWKPLALNIVHDLLYWFIYALPCSRKDLRQDMSWKVLDLVRALSIIWLNR